MSEFSQGSAHEFDSVQSWQLALERNVVRLGNEMGSWGDVLASHVQLRLTTGDDQFQIIPELKSITNVKNAIDALRNKPAGSFLIIVFTRPLNFKTSSCWSILMR